MFSFNLMFSLVMMNLLGLSPLTYSTSTNLWIILFMAICMWMMLMISSWSFDIKGSIGHLSPNGAPLMLLPFLVLIELVSMCIRPLTLTVRVIANISAGHVVLSLISSCLTVCDFTSFTVVFFVGVFYTIFEIFVCFIQAYIFSLLIKIYSEEHQ
nr:ATP synthase F0 subunit 6 [Runcina aurata]